MSYSKYILYKKQISYDDGETWIDTSATSPSGSCIGTYDTLSECNGNNCEEVREPTENDITFRYSYYPYSEEDTDEYFPPIEERVDGSLTTQHGIINRTDTLPYIGKSSIPSSPCYPSEEARKEILSTNPQPNGTFSLCGGVRVINTNAFNYYRPRTYTYTSSDGLRTSTLNNYANLININVIEESIKNITSIKSFAFYGCRFYGLESTISPLAGTRQNGKYTFSKELVHFNFVNVQEIGDSAFSHTIHNYVDETSYRLGFIFKNIKKIGKDAFKEIYKWQTLKGQSGDDYCKVDYFFADKLNVVLIFAQLTPPSIDGECIESGSDIWVPDVSLEAYQAVFGNNYNYHTFLANQSLNYYNNNYKFDLTQCY